MTDESDGGKIGYRQTGGSYNPARETFSDWQDRRDALAAVEYEKYAAEDDIKAIADSSGFAEDEIQQIKRHIFEDEHILYDEVGKVDPDYNMAVAWKRLRSGVPEERDKLLLHHELLESQLEKKYELTLSEAHNMANKTYNWQDEIIRLFGEEGGEDDGLL